MKTLKYIDDYRDHIDINFKDDDNFLLNIHESIPDDILEITNNLSEYEQSAINSIILITKEVIIENIERLFGRIEL